MPFKPVFPLVPILLVMACRSGASALEPDAASIRVSVKRVLSPSGALPTGRWGSSAEISGTIAKSNDALARSGSKWVLNLLEVRDTQAAAGFYSMEAHEISTLDNVARANQAAYLWRNDAINIYVVNEITDAGGVCSFPPDSEVIVINSLSILGGSEGWLHEMGHYFNLIHTHEGDLVADTVGDTPLPEPFDCGDHDLNFSNLSRTRGDTAADSFNLLHNIMSYHCDPQILTPLQLIRMHRALLDFRLKVREPLSAPVLPVAQIAFDPESSGGVVGFNPGATALNLDGSGSNDGEGGREVSCRWTVVSGPAAGSRFAGLAAGWELGCSGIGYGDDDDMTELLDMRNRYITVYMTRAFDIADPARVTTLGLDVTYDDGFAAYLNGVEIVRRNLPAAAGNATAASASVESVRELIDLTPFKSSLIAGSNRLSIEVHNSEIGSSDLSMHPVLSAQIQGQGARVLIPSRAVWYYQKGSLGNPPADWKEAGFDPAARRAALQFTSPGVYRFRLTVNDGLPPGNLATAEVEVRVVEHGFIRGDSNSSGSVDLADAVFTLLHLFLGHAPPPCMKAADVDDSGVIELNDPVAVLEFLFSHGAPLPSPYPGCGEDATEDPLTCDAIDSCGG